jgi:hypothetical protein
MRRISALTSRAAWGSVIVLLIGAHGAEALADGPLMKPRLRDPEHHTRIDPPLGDVVSGPMTLVPLSPSERQLAAQFLPRHSGGGDVTDLQALQLAYSDPTAGNVVRLIWTENTSNNPQGVSVLIDGQLLGTVPGLDTLPGTNSVDITRVAAGKHTFRVEGEGTSAEATLLALQGQPFSDAQNVACREGPRNDVDGTCALVISWTNPGPVLPSTYLIIVNNVVQTEIPGTQTTVSFTGAPAGDYTCVVLGFLRDANGFYRGGFPQTTCTLACLDQPCQAPFNLLLCQNSHGADPSQNSLLALWTNGEVPAYAVGVNGFIDGTPAGTLSGDSQAAIFSQLSVGQHTIGIQGDCGPDGVTTTTEGTFNVLAQTPHTHPIAGSISCQFDEPTGELRANWTNADPSIFIDVYLVRGQNVSLVNSLDGNATAVTITGALATDSVMLQFFAIIGGDCHGSDNLTCQPGQAGKKYIEGLCNGEGGVPDISSAVFGLAYLYLGGEKPPCTRACNMNGDDTFDISDIVYLLSYLFTGGTPPTHWVDSTGDTVPDPTCSVAEPTDDCDTGSATCP